LPRKLEEDLERIHDEGNPRVVMDVLRAGCSTLGALEPEGDFGHQTDTPTLISPPRVLTVR